MTADIPFSRPRPAAPSRPGDAVRASRELMTVPGHSRDERTWRLVHIRVGGEWRSGILTVWRRPPSSRVWVAHVRWGEDDQWGWFVFDPATIRPAPEPAGAAAPGPHGRTPPGPAAPRERGTR
ncbi:hypothetical protein [Kitasatospora camelliae]|uniref:Uncharacterized protein n=1 Tax=Kitasatospora camelliae TaxID=3156397 RepID=A0AAU8K6Z8_9ACTN